MRRNLKFGPWPIKPSEIFYNSKYSYGLTNLKPVVPGHVLVISKRVCPRINDLSHEEMVDMATAVHKISKEIERIYAAESLTITIQDGPSAGQSVPHVHYHIMPRFKGDWLNNDDIYHDINQKEKQMGTDLKFREQGPDNDSREPRTEMEMAAEAANLRPLFEQFEDIWN